jgi:hypothetical protein
MQKIIFIERSERLFTAVGLVGGWNNNRCYAAVTVTPRRFAAHWAGFPPDYLNPYVDSKYLYVCIHIWPNSRDGRPRKAVAAGQYY